MKGPEQNPHHVHQALRGKIFVSEANPAIATTDGLIFRQQLSMFIFQEIQERLLTMKCPACKEPDLVMSERQGVEIDYCPTCRGVWLDRGELDKIIDKSMEPTITRPAPPDLPRPTIDPYYDNRGHYEDHYKQGSHHGHRRKSWLGELFD
jgi:Zn-finger nucleic acid-binding protein